MNNNSDFESGAFLDLECSQQFKPSQTLANFLESTEQELQSQQTVSNEINNLNRYNYIFYFFFSRHR